VAIDKNALANASQADIRNIEKLVSAAVGAREERGDIVTVVTRPFTEVTVEEPPFYETGWFAMVVRNAVALLAVLLVLLLAVRPALKMLRGKGGKPNEKNDPATAQLLPPDGEVDREGLDAQIQLAQRIAHEQPQDAVMALRRMLAEPMPEGAAR
jgi:flagellar M-ring protein FliF